MCILGDTLLFGSIFCPLSSALCVWFRVSVVFLCYCADDAGWARLGRRLLRPPLDHFSGRLLSSLFFFSCASFLSSSVLPLGAPSSLCFNLPPMARGSARPPLSVRATRPGPSSFRDQRRRWSCSCVRRRGCIRLTLIGTSTEGGRF
jgi:hypothetical protein